MEKKYRALGESGLWADKAQKEILLQDIHPAFEPGAAKIFRGVADGTGRIIIGNEKYLFVDQFNNGLARAQDRVTRKWGFIDRHGNEVIPCIWNKAMTFKNGHAMVSKSKGTSGYISTPKVK